jgi:hypothetical protein
MKYTLQKERLFGAFHANFDAFAREEHMVFVRSKTYLSSPIYMKSRDIIYSVNRVKLIKHNIE